MKNSINLFFAMVLGVFSFGCATKPVHEGAYRQAQWETKAMIRNLKEQKTQTVDIDIMAIKNDRARFEITAILGFQVASLVMSPQEISYAIYPEQKFFYGRSSESAVARMIGLPLHPMNLSYIAFDQPVRGPGWKCYAGPSGLISKCENQQRAIHVEWKDRSEGKKKVVITAPQFEMQWLFNAPQTEVQFKPETFTLKQPSGFKAIQIN